MRNVMFMLCLLLVAVAVGAMADDSTKAEGMPGHEGMGEMPPMGAPPEMKELAFLEGDWAVVGKMKMMPTQSDWTDYTGSCEYGYIADGAAMYSEYIAAEEIMGMRFIGLSLMTYDRETKTWQVTWVDNMGARQTMYTGTRDKNGTVSTGTDHWGGQTMLTRITTWDETATSFKWKMEHSSDDGKTWRKNMEATYTKK